LEIYEVHQFSNHIVLTQHFSGEQQSYLVDLSHDVFGPLRRVEVYLEVVDGGEYPLVAVVVGEDHLLFQLFASLF